MHHLTLRACAALLLTALSGASFAAATTPGNLLISSPSDQTITEYTWEGQVVQRFDIALWEPSLRFSLGDVVQAANGTIYAYSGDLEPALTSLDPKTGAQRNLPMPDISMYNAPSGGIATKGQYLFLGDMDNSGSPDSGIVRFNIHTGATDRFASGFSFRELTIGGDGLLYAGAQDLRVYDPTTMTLVRTVTVGDPYANYRPRTLAVDAQGFIYSATSDGRINKHTATGQVIASLQTQAQLQDIEIDAQGRIVMTTWDETVYTTDTSLTTLHQFQATGLHLNYLRVGIAVAPAVPEPASYALMLAGVAAIGLVARRRRHGPR